MSKKNDILATANEPETYDLNQNEKNQLNSIIELMHQAQTAQDLLYSNLVRMVAERHEISGASININMDEVIEKGADVARLNVQK